MEINSKNLFNIKPAEFLPSFMVTWISVLTGSVLSMALILSAGIFERGGFLYNFVQHFGVFIFSVSILAGYCGVYMTVNSGSGVVSVKDALRKSFKKSGYVLLISLIVMGVFTGFILLQAGFSMVAEVPYIGAGFITLLTAPLFILNFAAIIVVICFFTVFPTVIADVDSAVLKTVFADTIKKVKSSWLQIVLYLFVSVTLLAMTMLLILFIARYSGGITKALQWKINMAYSASMSNMITGSYFSDLIYAITPEPESLSALKRHGPENILMLLRIGKNVVTVSYILLVSLLISFPLAVFFRITSQFLKKI